MRKYRRISIKIKWSFCLFLVPKENNFPPFPKCCKINPCFYHDISMEIPIEWQKTCRMLFYVWQGKLFLYECTRNARFAGFPCLFNQKCFPKNRSLCKFCETQLQRFVLKFVLLPLLLFFGLRSLDKNSNWFFKVFFIVHPQKHSK